VAEEEEVILVNYHSQILSLTLPVLQTGDEVEVFVVEVEDILR
jgi:hypothetical protein